MTRVRRFLAGAVSVGLLTGMATLPQVMSGVAHAAPAPTAGKLNNGLPPCEKYPDVKGKKPGKLLGYQELSVDPSQLTGARMFRVLFTTSGLDERHVQASCGLVVMPEKGQSNEILAWAHGTVGVHQSCMASNNPGRFLSNGAIQFPGTALPAGEPSNGIWQGLIDEGRMITAPDYYSAAGRRDYKQQNYVAGIPEGAAVLDSVRTGIQLVKKVKHQEHRTWELGLWGASQGGHAALWAGQLAKRYLSETAVRHQPAIKQVGIVAAVPASSFIANDKTPRRLLGYHLGDLEMHQQAGPVLFSYVLDSWKKYGDSGKPGRHALFPGYPRGVRPALSAVLSPEGKESAEEVAALCTSDAVKLAAAIAKYLVDPAANPFFIPSIWGKPDSQGVYQGRMDRTCRSKNVSKGINKWCTWLSYNMPGPQGINPFSKLPRTADGSVAPVLITEGMDDTLVYCQNDEPTLPQSRACLARQLYKSMATKKVCRDTSVRLDLYAKTNSSPASHFTTMYQLADNGRLGYRGSIMDRFLNKAFKHKVGTGCSERVVNK
ncbi:MAG: lipase family protein [Candidatus Nanopelagicales bacterium]